MIKEDSRIPLKNCFAGICSFVSAFLPQKIQLFFDMAIYYIEKHSVSGSIPVTGIGTFQAKTPSVKNEARTREKKDNLAKNEKTGHLSGLERVRGIEPLPKDWKSLVLPLNYTRKLRYKLCLYLLKLYLQIKVQTLFIPAKR